MAGRVDELRDRWQALSAGQRTVVSTVAVLDASLRVVALTDLARRPPHEVRGPKWLWALSLSVVSSMGLVPLAYVVRGRRTH